MDINPKRERGLPGKEVIMGSRFSNKAKTRGTPVPPPGRSSTQHSATHRSPLTNRRSLVFVLALGVGAFAIAYGLTKLRQKAGSPADDSPLTSNNSPPDHSPLTPHDSPPGMVWIPGGEFTMGTDDKIGWQDEKPAHRVR